MSAAGQKQRSQRRGKAVDAHGQSALATAAATVATAAAVTTAAATATAAATTAAAASAAQDMGSHN